MQVDPAKEQVGRGTAVRKCRGDREITDVHFCEVRKDRNHQITYSMWSVAPKRAQGSGKGGHCRRTEMEAMLIFRCAGGPPAPGSCRVLI